MDPVSTLDGKDGENLTATSMVRDPTYFFPPDMDIVLKVEDTLFRIHLFHLLKHSDHFTDLLDSGAALGFTETNPFVVDRCIKVEDVRHFLRIILPSVTENLEMFWTTKGPDAPMRANKMEWLSVLKVSTVWRCQNLRQLAINELQILGIRPVDKILVGRKLYIRSWVETGYREVVENEELISDEDVEVIGALGSFKLSRLILENQLSSRMRQSTAVVSPMGSRNLSLERRIQQNFQAELESISATEALLKRRETK